MNDTSIHIYFVNAVIKQAYLQGYDVERLLQRSRISPRLLHEPQARVSPTQFARLQTLTMIEMDDEILGYCHKPLKIGQWSALCHWLIQCKNLGQALKRYCLFYELMETGLKPELYTEGNSAWLNFSPWKEDEGKLDLFVYELLTFTLHRLICWLTKSIPALTKVELCYPPPQHISEYKPLYLGTHTQFNAPVCRFVFDRKLLGRPIVQTPETLVEFLRNPPFQILVNNYQGTSWTQRIKKLISSDISTRLSFIEIADTLEVNPKKLRRLLLQEGTTYRDIKLQVLRDTAIYHLSNQGTSVEEIAFKTGFSEASAFIRAFKKWTGVTPYTYRKDLS